MATAAFVIGFLALGAGVAYVAFWGGPGGARQAYLTRGRRGFRIAIPILYIALGLAIPAVVIADHKQAKGAQGSLRETAADPEFEEGRELFRQACWNCHTLKAAGASGNVGPNLDEADIDYEGAVKQIANGGGGMPPFKGQLSDKQIADVAAYVVKSSGGKAP